jgi:hypothetical protein
LSCCCVTKQMLVRQYPVRVRVPMGDRDKGKPA